MKGIPHTLSTIKEDKCTTKLPNYFLYPLTNENAVFKSCFLSVWKIDLSSSKEQM